MVRASVLVSLTLRAISSILNSHLERLPGEHDAFLAIMAPAEQLLSSEQHCECRAPWKAPGSHPTFIESGREIFERYAAPWCVPFLDFYPPRSG